MLVLAGEFWIGIIGSVLHRPEIVGPVGIIGAILLLQGSLRLHRKSAGFRLDEMKNGTEEQRRSLQTIGRGFRWAMLLETALCTVAVGSVDYFHRLDLLWPALGIAVSLHFLPLGRLFRVRSYYFAGIAGTVVCGVAIVGLNGAKSVLFAAVGMCVNMWSTAAWLLSRSEQIAARAIHESSNALTV